jgi:hypothetical protein
MDFCPNLLLGKPQYILLHLLQKKMKEAVFWPMCVLRQIYIVYIKFKMFYFPPLKLTDHSHTLEKY